MHRKKAVPCPECKGTGRIILTRAIPDLCGIGTKPCENCSGTGNLWEDITHADYLRTMDDWELARYIYHISSTDGCYCKRLPECAEDLKQNRDIPDERCIKCLFDYLRKPAEVIECSK